MDLDSRPRIPRQQSLVLPDVLNPFKHSIQLNWCDFLKLSLMTITVFPVRCAMIVIIMLLAWPLAYIGLAGRKEEEKNEPVTGWRSHLRTFVFLMWRTIFFCGGFHWIRTIGERASSIAAPIMAVAPHSSFLDAVLPSVILGCSVVAKKETADAPVFGTLIKFTQPVFVSREDPNSRLNTIKEIQNRARSGGKWPQIIIFPEGTCTNRSALITFKPGAFYPGVPVQPVILRYPNRTDSVTWTWDGPGVAKLFWLTLCQFHNYLEVEYLPVYKPSDAEMKDPHLYAKNVRDSMAKELGVPATDHTFDDCRLMMYARQHNIPMTSGLIEFNKLNRKLGIKFDSARDMMSDFAKISKDGHLTLAQFADYLHLPITEALSDLFRLYDRDQSGTIDFREYMIGLSLVAMPACTEDTLRYAFQLMDLNQDGHICEDELLSILGTAVGMKAPQVRRLFTAIDMDQDGKITYEEFRAYAQKKPEYAKLFVSYHEKLQESANHVKSKNDKDKSGRTGNLNGHNHHHTQAPSAQPSSNSQQPSCGATSTVIIHRTNHGNSTSAPLVITGGSEHTKSE